EDFPALHAAARLVGGHQIRNVGTIGGNLGNASPAADVAVALLALDARICVQGPRGVRAIAIDDFFFGPGKTALAPAELIESIDLDCPAAGETSRFLKVGRRQAMEIAVASVAVGLRLRADGTCERARIALGAVGPRPLRARAAERMLEGRPLDADAIACAAAGAGAACSPRSDVRASADYRRKVVEEGVHRLLSGWTEGTPCRT
ncbi:MAG: FAD binding domain-containing protein, partial [Variibacter sp.]|nr:FAD binding domain-containing protein [Variibacter sp.]